MTSTSAKKDGRIGNTSLTADEEKLVEIFKALGNPTRLEMLRYIAGSPQCITGTLVEFSSLAQSTVSQHLKVLRDAGLICGTVEGPATCYSVNMQTLKWLNSAFDEITQDLVEACSSDGAMDRVVAELNQESPLICKSSRNC